MTDRRPLGQILIERAKLTAPELEQGLLLQRAHGGRIGAVLIRMGALSEETLLPVLCDQTGIPLVAVHELPVDGIQQARERIRLSPEWMSDHRVLLWWADDAIHAASPDPLDPQLRDAVRGVLRGGAPVWHFIRAAELEQAIAHHHAPSLSGDDVAALRELAEDAPIIALVNNVVAQAIEARASDIHIEPGEANFEIRYRIDGVLHQRQKLPMGRYPAVASRVKLVANLDIAERRLPQDGRISLRAAGTELDVRVSTIPAVHGESIVLRLLPKRRSDLSLSVLGMDPSQLERMERWLEFPNGLILVTGPTGSGKSTTLYSALASVTDATRKIVTVEDPVEYRLPGIVQIQTQSEIGYTFAKALRAILRHDPDIIMVGEIRDRETAEIAIQSALTGHLVLATIHTNDAPSAFTRLVDMGIEPFLVAASVRAVMAQRLVRRLCGSCSVAASVPRDIELELATQAELERQHGHAAVPGTSWRHGIGCPACGGTGYRGRVGIYEMLSVTEEIQHAVAEGQSALSLRTIAQRYGFRSLRADGLFKASQGVTTLDESLRTTSADMVST
ncbi:GspE/PulE family protein [Niveibacterium umoris]|uniref:General secretion pathway protein E n=1 Tax=Niveibacterium umoris TaxID=1193620 RepID=A0A840BKV3_9RHOO|nr:GspE/PulE family protein [Niveibacterium umoris]MBB4012252.1 general secretion pathway protein E [Niveibacterium umoris]